MSALCCRHRRRRRLLLLITLSLLQGAVVALIYCFFNGEVRLLSLRVVMIAGDCRCTLCLKKHP